MLKRLNALVPRPSATDIPVLDGLRGLAMLMILVVHSSYEADRQLHDATLNRFISKSSPIYTVGPGGVDLFFVLSGFLLFLPYASAILGERDFPDTRKFYIRRMLRILPAYWCSLVALLLIFDRHLLTSGAGIRLVLANVFLVLNTVHGARESINGVFWTMAVESQFYLILPLMAWALYRAKRSGGFGAAGLVFAALSAISPLRGAVGLTVNMSPLAHRLFGLTDLFNYLSTFVVGMLASLFYTALLNKRLTISVSKARVFAQASGVVGLLMIVGHQAAVQLGVRLATFDYVFFQLYIGLAYGGILLGSVLGWAAWRRALSTWFMRFMGMISYSVYIWHYHIYWKIVVPLAGRCTSGYGIVLAVVALTFILVFPFGLLSFLVT